MPGTMKTVPDPNDVNTFMRSKLDWNKADTEEGRAWLHVTRELIVLRQRFIVPLLKQRGTVEGNVLQTALGMVAVSWRFPSGTLSLALNIGKKPLALPDLPGKTIFSWPEAVENLPPNSIVVRFADGEAAL